MNYTTKKMDLEEIREQLKSFKGSLFKITTDITLESAAKVFSTSENNRIYEIAARLIAGDVENVEEHIESAVKETPGDIHAWCNKGMYHVLKGETDSARDAASQVESLRQQHLPVQKAMLDHASWLAKIGKNNSSAMLKAIEIIEDVIFDESSKEKNEPASLFEASYQYVSTIIKYSYCRGKYEKVPTSWYEEKVIGLLDEIQRSGNQKESLQVYLLLVQLESLIRQVRKIHEDLSRMDVFKEFSRKSGLEELNYKICIDKLHESSLASTDSKFCAQMANYTLHFAFDAQHSKDDRVKYLRKVLQLCEASFAKGESDEKIIETACQAEFNLWALDHFAAYRESVNLEYQELHNNNRINGVNLSKAARLICLEAYFIKDTEDADRRRQLERVRGYMQKLKGRGRKSTNTAHLARVKYILGESDAEVKDTFEEAVASPHVFERYQVLPFTFYGRFLEKIGSTDEAREKYEEAIHLAPRVEDKEITQTAKNRIRAIKQRINRRSK